MQTPNGVRFKFSTNFDWLVRQCMLCKAVTVAYKAGHELFVPRDVAEAAKQARAGEEVRPDA